jgi:predicted metal-binding transcription factor (methanogenesis marker protein 9)
MGIQGQCTYFSGVFSCPKSYIPRATNDENMAKIQLYPDESKNQKKKKW